MMHPEGNKTAVLVLLWSEGIKDRLQRPIVAAQICLYKKLKFTIV